VVIYRVSAFLALPKKALAGHRRGCGTGLSTIALKPLAERIVGVDAAAEMIGFAASSSDVEYVVASAENLPFAEGDFDLMTLSSAFHWVDRSLFLAEARRVIRSRGWLIIYENFFSGQMQGNAEYLHWTRSQLLARYPNPAAG
jgi:ubiquinone/menaquinone biosynthesis C-methylase UbiE